jgi:hypothetical protein
MKNLTFLLLAFGLILFGCSEYSNLINSNPAQEAAKQRIALPAPVNLSVETVLYDEADVDGAAGGELEVVGTYQSVDGDVTVSVELLVPPGAFEGYRVITLLHEGLFVDVELSPAMTFDTPVFLNATMTGVNLDEIDPLDIDFVYFAPDGSTEPVQYDSMVVDVENGVLSVTNAQLNHFSRYGWGK